MKHSMRLRALLYKVHNIGDARKFFEKFGYRDSKNGPFMNRVWTMTAKEVDSAPDRFGEIWTDYENKEQCMWHVDYHAPPKIILCYVEPWKAEKIGLTRLCYSTPFFDEVVEEMREHLEFLDVENKAPDRYVISKQHPVTAMEYEIVEKKEWE